MFREVVNDLEAGLGELAEAILELRRGGHKQDVALLKLETEVKKMVKIKALRDGQKRLGMI